MHIATEPVAPLFKPAPWLRFQIRRVGYTPQLFRVLPHSIEGQPSIHYLYYESISQRESMSQGHSGTENLLNGFIHYHNGEQRWDSSL